MRRIDDDRIARHDSRQLVTRRAPPGEPTPEREPVQRREREDHEKSGSIGPSCSYGLKAITLPDLAPPC